MIWICVGGALGSALRYGLQHYFGNVLGLNLPWGTLIANLFGSFLIGVVYAVFDRFPEFDFRWKFFLASGFCGGFTTFSTFSYEILEMFKTGNYILFSAYTILTFIGGFGLAFAGFWLVKTI